MGNQNDSYLAHHGVDGQKWGVRNGPPYPLERKRVKIGEALAKRKAKYAEVKAARKEKKAAKREEAKAKAVAHGSAREVEKYVKELTSQELTYVVNRLRLENTLKDYSKEERDQGKKLFDTMRQTSGDIKITADFLKNSKALGRELGLIKSKGKNGNNGGEGKKKKNKDGESKEGKKKSSGPKDGNTPTDEDPWAGIKIPKKKK